MRSRPATAARGAVAASAAESDEPMSNGCGQVEALDRQTAAIERLADELRQAVETITPAAHAIADLGAAQKKLCTFLVTHRVKIVLGAIAALAAVGVISPTAADGLKQVLHTWGPL